MGFVVSEKAVANERDCPSIVEFAVDGDPLDVELGRRIMLFHKSRHIEPRHGRQLIRNGQTYYRWCFADLTTARDFLEQFGGALIENSLVAGRG